MCEQKVDQPAGTGFSYTSTDRYVHTIDIVSSSTFARHVIRLNLFISPGSATVARIYEELLRRFPRIQDYGCVCFLAGCLFPTQYIQHTLQRLTLQEKVLQANGYPIMVSNSPSTFTPLIYLLFIADAILNSTLSIPLRGIAIGNGWIDANSHYLSYLDYAVKVGLIEENTDVRCIFSTLYSSIS